MYYAILLSAVTMFGFMFLFNQKYSALRGSSLRATFQFMFGGHTVGLLVLLIINRFQLEFTPFSLLMAFIAAADLVLYNVCSIRALGKINLSLFAVFAMLGGMTLPFVAGIVYFKETPTLGKGLCILFIFLSLAVTVDRKSGKEGKLYYIGVFIFNGLYGVIAKFFSAAPYNKTSEAAYSMLISMVVIIVSGICLVAIKKPKFEKNPVAMACSGVNGLLGNIGNFLSLIALRELPVSAQAPFVTGGTMIVSTVIAAFSKNKPTKKEYISVAIAFVGLLLLVFFDK